MDVLMKFFIAERRLLAGAVAKYRGHQMMATHSEERINKLTINVLNKNTHLT